jgi:hypothetical protein
LDGHLEDKPADGRDDRKSPPELPVDISQEMKAKTEELAVLHLTHPPEKIWWVVKNWADKEYAKNWFGLREDQVKNLAKSSRTKLGFGNFISTVEMVPEYRQMSDTKRAFLHCSATFPHPDKTEEVMRIMIHQSFFIGSSPRTCGNLCGCHVQAMHPIWILSVPHSNGVQYSNQFLRPCCLCVDVTQEQNSIQPSLFSAQVHDKG